MLRLEANEIASNVLEADVGSGNEDTVSLSKISTSGSARAKLERNAVLEQSLEVKDDSERRKEKVKKEIYVFEKRKRAWMCMYRVETRGGVVTERKVE